MGEPQVHILLRCFLSEDSFSGLKHVTEKMTARASLTHVWVTGDQGFIFCQNILSKRSAT